MNQVSRLHPLEPFGLKTYKTESITSYESRLAFSHRCSTGSLEANEILPMIGGKFCYFKSETRSAQSILKMHSISGIGLITAEVTTALESLTMRDDLHFLTMLPYAGVMGANGLLRKDRAWCPTCLDEQRKSGQEIYEHLAWTLELYKICLDHGSPLASTCPHCRLSNPFKSFQSYPGYCFRCKGWLGETGGEAIDLSNSDYRIQLEMAEQIGRMIQEAPSLERQPDKMHFMRLVDAVTRKIPKSKLARDIGVSSVMLKAWRDGKCIPGLEYLLRVCLRFNINAVDLVTGKVHAQDVQVGDCEKEFLFSRKQNLGSKVFDHKQARNVMDVAVKYGDPGVSVKELARKNLLDHRLLRKYFPVESLAITTRYLANIEARKKARISEKIRT